MSNKVRAWSSWLGCALAAGMLGVAYAGPSLLYDTVLANTNCTSAQFGFIFSAIGVGLLAGSLIVGKFMEINLKLSTLIGSLAPLVLYGSMAFSKDIRVIIVAGFIFGTLFQLCGNTVLSVVTARWFNKGRGTLISAAFVMQSLLQVVFNPLIASVVVNMGGTRAALLLGSSFTVVIALIMLLLVSKFPESYGMHAIDIGKQKDIAEDTENASDNSKEFESALPTSRIVRSPAYILLAVSCMLVAAGTCVYFSNSAMIFQNFGLSYENAARCMSICSVSSMLVYFLIGIIVDKISVQKGICLFAVLGGLGALLGAVLHGWIGAILFAILINGCTVWNLIPGVVLPAMYGAQKSTSLMGGLNFMGSLTSIIIAPIATGLFGMTGSYSSVLLIAGICALIGTLCIWNSLSSKTTKRIREESANYLKGSQQN